MQTLAGKFTVAAAVLALAAGATGCSASGDPGLEQVPPEAFAQAGYTDRALEYVTSITEPGPSGQVVSETIDLLSTTAQREATTGRVLLTVYTHHQSVNEDDVHTESIDLTYVLIDEATGDVLASHRVTEEDIHRGTLVLNGLAVLVVYDPPA